jgi:methyltransferase-like protein
MPPEPPEQDRYDAFAYPGYSYPHTHPDRLALMAILHGLSPTPVEKCRVLEIACGDGANLIPMAYAIPTAEFVGFDLARLPVERAQACIRTLGLRNIRILQGDLLKVGAELGRFDYIIAHGLYAWVPEPVRDRLLALCSELLAANGVVFVSYNALPGSYLRQMIRDMMKFGARDCVDPEETVRAGLDFLSWVVASRPESDAWRALLDENLIRLKGHPPASPYHDELSPVYRPVYITEFVEHANKHGLMYLSEAEMPLAPDPSYRAELQQTLNKVSGGDALRKEQALDFLRIRPYRETLLCRAGQPVRHDYFPESFANLLVASQAESEPGEQPGSRTIKVAGGIKMETSHPAVIWLLEQLGRAWPRALSFRELMPGLEERDLKLDNAGALILVRLAVAQAIELRTWNPAFAESVSERPRASAYAREQARQAPLATTFLHASIKLDDPKVHALLLLLDGTRNRADLVAALREQFPQTPLAQIEEGIEPSLQHFFEGGVLEA